MFAWSSVTERRGWLGLLLCCLLAAGQGLAQSNMDTTYRRLTYFRIGLDAASFLRPVLLSNGKGYEFQVDGNLNRQTNLALEGGFGSGLTNNRFLRYPNRNSFVRIGIDRNFFSREHPGDMDNAFVGIRYATSVVNRGAGEGNIFDSFWGDTTFSIPGKRFVVHWLELTGGFRLELLRNLFAGWNVRARTFLNPAQFEELPPSYLGGYGRGDRNAVFGVNLYLLYGIGRRP